MRCIWPSTVYRNCSCSPSANRYIVKIALNGSVPMPMVTMVATETPLCTGRARDVFRECEFGADVSGPSALTRARQLTHL